ncbi:carbohydrate ABC transporter permease [Paenibacillus albus]|uniref:carbohydrate ABC transporter permease n=1 Tax=Paenibacillus albus TaxID=2495582 RepID=UPI001D131CFE|nr:hypothetical protein [Paenibacillus albus]
MHKIRLSPYLFTAPAVLLFLFTILLPIVMTFVFSFYDWNGFGVMKFTGFDNYVRAFHDHIYLLSYWHILIYIVLTIFLEVFVGLLLAGLITVKLRGTSLFRVAFLRRLCCRCWLPPSCGGLYIMQISVCLMPY